MHDEWSPKIDRGANKGKLVTDMTLGFLRYTLQTWGSMARELRNEIKRVIELKLEEKKLIGSTQYEDHKKARKEKEAAQERQARANEDKEKVTRKKTSGERGPQLDLQFHPPERSGIQRDLGKDRKEVGEEESEQP